MKTIHYIRDDKAIREFRMVQACVDRKQYRPALQGVYFQFSADGASITGTDGKRLVHVSSYPLERDIGHSDPVDMIVSFDAMVPKGAVSLTLTVDHDEKTAILQAETKRSQKLIPGKLLENMQYPDYQQILKQHRYGPDREPTVSSIGLNPLLVADIYSAFLLNGSVVSCEFRFRDSKEPIRVHIAGTDADIVVMPSRTT